jgi:hypothetical protein
MDQYAGRLKQLEEQLAVLDADTSNQVLPPEVAAQRARRSRGMGDLGMVAQVGGFEHLKGLGAQLARQAMADEELKVANGGVYDPTSGQHTLFPGTVRENQRKRLEGEQGRVFLQQQRAQDTAERDQERFARQVMLKGMMAAGRGRSGGGGKGPAPAPSDASQEFTTATKTAAAKNLIATGNYRDTVSQMKDVFDEMEKTSPNWSSNTAGDGLLSRARGKIYATGKSWMNDPLVVRLEGIRTQLAAKATREADSNPTARQMIMLLDTFPGVERGPKVAKKWVSDALAALDSTAARNQAVLDGKRIPTGASGSFDAPDAPSGDFDALLNQYAPKK